MAKNTDAIEKALKSGRTSLARAVPEYGEAILKDFKASVSTQFPPQSAPGTPPHMRTGGYMRAISIKRDRSRIGSGSLGITLYVRGRFNNALAIWLEYGTHRNGRPYMLPRPHWRTVPLPSAVRHRSMLSRALVRGERL